MRSTPVRPGTREPWTQAAGKDPPCSVSLRPESDRRYPCSDIVSGRCGTFTNVRETTLAAAIGRIAPGCCQDRHVIMRRGVGHAELDDGLLEEGRVGQLSA